MPAQTRKFSEVALRELCNQIIDRSGIPMTSMYHCSQLSLQLHSVVKNPISNFTIARVFGVLTSKSIPSAYTLDILADYIGFGSWDNFYTKHFDEICEADNNFSSPKSDFFVSKGELLMLKYTLEEKSYRPVIRYLEQKFSDLNSFCPTVYNDDIWKLSSLVGDHLRESPSANSELMPIISKIDHIRTPFFNYWVDMVGLDTYYSHLIENSFVNNIHPTSSDYCKDEIWVYSIRMYHAIYTLNKKKLLKSGYQLYEKYPETKVNLSITPYLYPILRFHAMHIVYRYYSEPKTPFSWYEQKMIDYDNDIYGDESLQRIFRAGFFAEALYIANQHALLLNCFSETLCNLKAINSDQINRKYCLTYEEIQFLFYYHISYLFVNGSIEFNENKGFVYHNGLKTTAWNNLNLMCFYFGIGV
jgi:hypothetical protein